MYTLQARSKLSQIQDSQQEVSKSIEQYNSTLNGNHGGSMTNLADMSEGFSDRENGGFPAMVRAVQVRIFDRGVLLFSSVLCNIYYGFIILGRPGARLFCLIVVTFSICEVPYSQMDFFLLLFNSSCMPSQVFKQTSFICLLKFYMTFY